MKLNIKYRPHQSMWLKNKKIISNSLAIGLFLNSSMMSFAGVLSEDGRYETFEGDNITIDNVLEEGNIELDTIEGNTMVNYAQNGDKELSLNGEIDLEGTSVTTTEGVDGGLVDVEIEGNTLVNLFEPTSNNFSGNTDWSYFDASSKEFIWDWSKGQSHNNWIQVENKLDMLEVNKTYTLIYNVKEFNPTLDGIGVDVQYYGILWGKEGSDSVPLGYSSDKGLITKVFTVTEDNPNMTSNRLGFFLHSKTSIDNGSNVLINGGKLVIGDIMLLEGDWTDKEIPPYFEGMKSVGELEDNKIEILSHTSNLGEYELEVGALNYNTGLTYDDNNSFRTKDFIELNSLLINSYQNITNNYGYKSYYTYIFYDENKNFLGCRNITKLDSVQIPNGSKYFKFFTLYGKLDLDVATFNSNVWYSKSQNQSYLPHSLDKKEISLNEPLRGLPNGVKDRIIKKDGKWYIERNCGEVVFNGGEDCSISGANGVYPSILRLWVKNISNLKEYGNILCDKLPIAGNKDHPSIICTNGLDVHLPLSNDTSLEVAKQWLSENPIKVVYTLITPTYEEITDVELTTYLDTTHISNNSTIPCNMQVKNSGYNTIIKPSTTYTVAFDTNKNGEVNIDLGGAKTSTTNNVATITTPKTLTDDSLRLCGKGIKTSNIMLLEGDKTDNIPGYFEGMKSSFEDKLQNNGTYKMEILSNNKNLFNGIWVYDEGNNRIKSDNLIRVKPNTTYTISDNLNYRYQIFEYSSSNKHFNSMYPYAGSYTFTTSKRTHYLRFSTYAPSTDVNVKFLLEEGRNVNSYEPNKSSKIQLSTIEPLRAVGDVKDRIIKRNGQWVIERNCGEVVLDGSENWRKYINGDKTYSFLIENKVNNIFDNINTVCLSNIKTQAGGTVSYLDEEGLYIRGDSDFIYVKIDKSKLTYDNIENFKKWLSENPITVVYQLETPIYESLNINPSLDTYLDITHISNNSNIPANMKVTYDRALNRATEAIELAKTNPTVANIALARMWTNLLKDSTLKDEINNEINNIVDMEDLQIEKKKVTSNLDVYIKSDNMLLMSLSTNTITFDNFSGVSDMELDNAINISVNSSLPYQLNSYLLDDLYNSDKSAKIDKDLLNIKTNSDTEYKMFTALNQKLVLEEDCEAGNNNPHTVDLILRGTNAHVADVYKTTIKFEVEQK